MWMSSLLQSGACYSTQLKTCLTWNLNQTQWWTTIKTTFTVYSSRWEVVPIGGSQECTRTIQTPLKSRYIRYAPHCCRTHSLKWQEWARVVATKGKPKTMVIFMAQPPILTGKALEIWIEWGKRTISLIFPYKNRTPHSRWTMLAWSTSTFAISTVRNNRRNNSSKCTNTP